MISNLNILIGQAIPLVFDQSMSFLELLGAVVAKVNELIAADNAYFSVDMQSNLRNILNQMETDGRLAALINASMTTEINTTKADLALEKTKIVSLQLKNTNRKEFNVLDYGALGNGVADDLISIQAAITAATAAGGGIIIFPAGNYKITNAIALANNIVCRGAGREITRIKPATGGQTAFSLVNAPVTRAYTAIENIAIIATALNIKAIHTLLSSAIRFENLLIAGCMWNFHIDQGTNITVKDILIEGTATMLAGKSIFESTNVTSYLWALDLHNYHIRNIGNGVQSPAITLARVVGAQIDGLDMNDLSAGGSNADGILITDDSQGIRIENPIIVKPYTNGIKIVGANGHVPIAVEIINAHIDQTTINGINIENGGLINVIGGMITSTGTNGIVVGTDGCLIQGVNITTGGSNGVLIQTNVGRFRILGNVISGYGTAIAIVAGTGNRYIVKDNDLSIANTNKILDGGTGTVKYISDNILT